MWPREVDNSKAFGIKFMNSLGIAKGFWDLHDSGAQLWGCKMGMWQYMEIYLVVTTTMVVATGTQWVELLHLPKVQGNPHN